VTHVTTALPVIYASSGLAQATERIVKIRKFALSLALMLSVILPATAQQAAEMFGSEAPDDIADHLPET
jgi:hypothetical protein